jgi:hypothetical protein
LIIHFSVSGFIKGRPSTDDLSHEAVAGREAVADALRGTNHQVERKAGRHFEFDFRRLVSGMSLVRHDDEQIHIRILRGSAVSVGTKEDDPLGMKLARHGLRVFQDAGAVDHRLDTVRQITGIFQARREGAETQRDWSLPGEGGGLGRPRKRKSEKIFAPG